LAGRLTAYNEKAGAPSYRDLRDAVAGVLGEAHAVSHETIRKYHTGDQPWGSIRVDVVKALARIYDSTLRELSPELADIDEGYGPTQQRRSKTCMTVSASDTKPLVAA
jgi:hypothetical protein